MKRITIGLLSGILFLTACGQSTSAVQVTPIIEQTTATPSPISTATQTSLPSATPTASITPLPTIPTFTPTFDVSTILTVTPAPKAECPKENPKLVPDFPYCDDKGGCSGGPYNEATLTYLNAGGTLDKLEKKHWGTTADLTGDGVKELAFTEWGMVFIYGCKEGKYETLLKFEGTQNTPVIDHIIDLNKNGIPELIISNPERRYFRSIHITEWNGKEFTPLIDRQQVNYNSELISIDWVGGTAFIYEFIDINKDGLKEIVAVDNDLVVPDYLPGLPLRKITTSLVWNGKNFVVLSDESSPPEYRFQAIQDADEYILHGEYEKALSLYQDTIFNDNLDWWSKGRKEYESYNALNNYFANWLSKGLITATPYPTLPAVAIDLTEYLVSPPTPTTASCSYTSSKIMNQMQPQPTTPCKKNSAMTHMLVLM